MPNGLFQKEKNEVLVRKSWRYIKLGELLYFSAWILFSASYIMLRQTELYNFGGSYSVYTAIVYATLALLTLNFLFGSVYTKKEVVIYVLFLLIVFLIEYNWNDKNFLVYIAFIMGFKGINYNFSKLVSIDFFVKLSCLVLTVILCLVGYLNDYIAIFGNGTIKHAFGFYHPNTLGMMVFSILLEWLYLRYKKLHIWEWLLIGGCILVVNELVASRSSVYTFTLIYFLFILARVKPIFFQKKFVKVLFTLSLPIIAAFSYLMVYLYAKGNFFAIEVNATMTNRLKYAAMFVSEYGFSIFGKSITLVSSRAAQEQNISSEILDMSYLRAPIMWGVLFSVIFFAGMILLIKRALDAKQINLALFSLFYIVIGFGEATLLVLCFNMTMLFILKEIVPSRKQVIKRLCLDSRKGM